MIQKQKMPGPDAKRFFDLNAMDIRNILEEIPRPILLVNHGNGRIISANSCFSEFAQMGAVEISSLMLSDIISSTEIENINDGGKINTTLSLGHEQYLDVEIHSKFISPKENLVLLLFKGREKINVENANLWEEFSKKQAAIINKIHEFSLTELLNEIIRIGKQITISDEFVFYTLEQGNAFLKKVPAVTSLFPEQIPALELTRINEIDFWEPGKRVLSEIHRVGRLNRFSSIISIPVISENRHFGLIISAFRESIDLKTKSDLLIQYSSWVPAIIELFNKVHKRNEDLKNLDTKLKKFKTFFNSSYDCVIILDKQNRILEFNPNFLELFDYLPMELINKNAEIIFGNSSLILNSLNHPQIGKDTFEGKEFEVFTRKGIKKNVIVSVVISGIGDEETRLVVLKDLTNMVSLQNRLVGFQKNAALGEVLSEFAHDVRNIVNRITTGLQLLVKKTNPDELTLISFQDLQNECVEMTDLMESVLSFSRQNYEKFKPENVKEMIERIFYRFQKKANKSNISLILNLANEEVSAWCDQRSLERVFSNILNNGIEAIGSEGGAVSVALSDSIEHPGCLLIKIADTGPGIPQNVQASLYQMYSTGKPEGTGLGLFISQKIVEYHKGWISLETFPGGTIFDIHIPKEKQGDSQ